MNDGDILSDSDFKRCVEFHGHVCPGVAIGFQAARTLMEKLGVEKASDEELLAYVENDACGADAIQVITGCTFGKGNFIFKNYGKHAFTLASRKQGRAFRACLLPDAVPTEPEYLSLSEKVQRGEPSPQDKARFKELHERRAEAVLRSDPQDLFKIEEIPLDLPPKARISQTATCALCGEPTKVDLLCEIDGQKVCKPCAESVVPKPRNR